MVHKFYLVLVLVLVLVALGELQEDGKMGVLGSTVALGVDFQSPLHSVQFARIGVDDRIWQLCVILEHIVKFGIFGDKFMSL